MSDIIRQCAKYAGLFYDPAGRYRIAESVCRRPPKYLPCDLLTEIRKQFGAGALLAADAVLFGWCLAAALLSDLLSARFPVPCGMAGFLCCAAAFNMCGEDRLRCLLTGLKRRTFLMSGRC